MNHSCIFILRFNVVVVVNLNISIETIHTPTKLSVSTDHYKQNYLWADHYQKHFPKSPELMHIPSKSMFEHKISCSLLIKMQSNHLILALPFYANGQRELWKESCESVKCWPNTIQIQKRLTHPPTNSHYFLLWHQHTLDDHFTHSCFSLSLPKKVKTKKNLWSVIKGRKGNENLQSLCWLWSTWITKTH